jgi:hypothetical protein
MRGFAMRRPSPSIVISLIALMFAMSGTAYAATGGTFILGKSNTARSVTGLANSRGTALSLSSAKGKPPLTVGNSVRVPKLNASYLDNTPASGFISGPGRARSRVVTVTGTQTVELVGSNDSLLTGQCDNGSTGADLYLNLGAGASAMWWSFNGVEASAASSQVTQLTRSELMAVVQVASGSAISTYIASQSYNPGTNSCTFTSQVLTT